MIRTWSISGWGYSAYPPSIGRPPYGYYGYYPGYVPGRALAAGVAFGLGVAWVNRVGGNLNWGGRDINIGSVNIGNRVNVGNNVGNKWQHNPVHRGGVRYNNASVQNRYAKWGRALGNIGG